MAQEYTQFPPQWRQHGTILYQRYGDPKPSDRLAMFDMDNTLMLTPSTIIGELVKGNKPWINKPAVANDLILYNPNVREMLLEEISNGRSIVVCSNQSQLFDRPEVSRLIFDRIQILLEKLDVPLYIMLAFKRDLCRKPTCGMLEFYETHLNDSIKVNRADSFYVGDAAGRRWPKEVLDANSERILALLKAEDFSDRCYMNKIGSKYRRVDANAIIANTAASSINSKFEVDFSDCDYKFALNNGLQFYTPEGYFAKLPRIELTLDFDPKLIGKSPIDIDIRDGLVILVGPPSCGKTFLCEKHLQDFIRISDSAYKSAEACLDEASKCLQRKDKVVIDSCNALESDREPYISLARNHGVKCTVIYLDVSSDFAIHFHRYRKIMKLSPQRLPSLDSIYRYYKRLEPPKESEGFDRMIHITDDTFPVEHNEVSKLHLP
ncbi:Polynucleotide kinase 3 phosphatase family protein [Babesia bovis T2Bo]|uniref:Polynucleotide kinase 3'-phosphatase, putative n=1 Tax=Babesia bovis TaxID=5865 RepID=A7AV41_BABBO|nr:Polynucleotide kinase 3 phosphatase family protein [Babesia bovis T2Bo]EDO05667.1 Polynucleotide kinase 3 phosphatase family protein [Babesia bovis T2Bo]|eukprot:XP_001609235.1 polynucleotide kinase 3'-phosphatase [Babesia bovis T2Bo]